MTCLMFKSQRGDCQTRYVVNSGNVVSRRESACISEDRSRQVDEQVTELNFIIYLYGPQVFVHGSDGWYHLWQHQSEWETRGKALNEVLLQNMKGGVWVKTEDSSLRSLSHQYSTVSAIAGRAEMSQIEGWHEYVRQKLILWHVWGAWGYLLNWGDYASEFQGWNDAVMNDLFHEASEQITASAHWQDSVANSEATDLTAITRSDPTLMLWTLAERLSIGRGLDSARFAATLLMLWERYFPNFRTGLALKAADKLNA